MDLELPRDRSAVVKMIRTLYYYEPIFASTVENLIRKINVPEVENCIRELLLFGEVFVWKNRSVLAPEHITVKFVGSNKQVFYEVDNPVQKINVSENTQTIMRRASPYDLRGSSFFNLSTFQLLDDEEDVIRFVKKSLEMLNPKPKFLQLDVCNTDQLRTPVAFCYRELGNE